MTFGAQLNIYPNSKCLHSIMVIFFYDSNLTSGNIYYSCICTTGPEISAQGYYGNIVSRNKSLEMAQMSQAPLKYLEGHTKRQPMMGTEERDQGQEWNSESVIFTTYIFVPFYFLKKKVY